MKQGNQSLEGLWNKFQDLWISIDARDPNPMDTPESIEKYNRITQRHRLYQFLWSLDEKYNQVKREILNRDPLPTVRTAYGMVRREAANEKVLKPTGDLPQPEIGAGLATTDRYRGRPPPLRITVQDKGRLTCSHCGGKKHTAETCFHIHGFPDWWEEMKKSRQNRTRSSGGPGGGGPGGGGSGGGARATIAAAVGD